MLSTDMHAIDMFRSRDPNNTPHGRPPNLVQTNAAPLKGAKPLNVPGDS